MLCADYWEMSKLNRGVCGNASVLGVELVNFRLGSFGGGSKEAKVASFIGLGDFPQKKGEVAAGELGWSRLPLVLALFEFGLGHFERQFSFGNIECD
jgi:hypothetical protein